jgi:hypothetical protein
MRMLAFASTCWRSSAACCTCPLGRDKRLRHS